MLELLGIVCPVLWVLSSLFFVDAKICTVCRDDECVEVIFIELFIPYNLHFMLGSNLPYPILKVFTSCILLAHAKVRSKQICVFWVNPEEVKRHHVETSFRPFISFQLCLLNGGDKKVLPHVGNNIGRRAIMLFELLHQGWARGGSSPPKPAISKSFLKYIKRRQIHDTAASGSGPQQSTVFVTERATRILTQPQCIRKRFIITVSITFDSQKYLPAVVSFKSIHDMAKQYCDCHIFVDRQK